MSGSGQVQAAAAVAEGGRATPARPLRDAVTAQRGLLTASITLFAGWQAAEALVPVVVGRVIDEAVATSDTSALIAWLGALAVLFAVLSCGFRFGERLNARVVEHAGVDLRLRLSARILHPRGGAAAGRAPGELLSIATVDATRAVEIARVLCGVAIIAAGAGVAAGFLLAASPLMGLIVLLGLPPVLLLQNLLTRALEQRSDAEQERAGTAAGLATDLVTGLRAIHGLRAEPAAGDRYRSASRSALHARRRATRLMAVQAGATVVITNAFLALVALVGARLAAQGRISIGELIAAVGLAQYLTGPLAWLGFLFASLAQARSSGRRVAAVLDVAPAVGTGPAPEPRGAGALRLAGLRHGALRDLDLDICAGEHLGLVVPDLAAASALLDCLAREVDPDAGAIRLDGADLLGRDPHAVRSRLLVAAHDADLFEDSVRANVEQTAADPARAAAALAASAADEVLAEVPPDLPLSEWGRSLSGGQRQRVALARALAADPPVLVLHDPTTAVDAVTEARIATGIRRMRAGRTTVLVTTSPPLLAGADRVVLVAGGSVAASGTHAALLVDDPAYRQAVLGC